MIVKYSSGTNFYEALRSALKSNKYTLPEQIRVLDAKDVCFDYDDDSNMVLDVKQVAWDFRQQVMFHKGEGVKPIEKPVYRFSLNYHPNDIVLDKQMLEDAKEFLDRIGFGNTQYVIISHRDKPHTYAKIVANIVDNEGKRISTHRLESKIHQVCAEMTQTKKYTWGKTKTQ